MFNFKRIFFIIIVGMLSTEESTHDLYVFTVFEQFHNNFLSLFMSFSMIFPSFLFFKIYIKKSFVSYLILIFLLLFSVFFGFRWIEINEITPSKLVILIDTIFFLEYILIL